MTACSSARETRPATIGVVAPRVVLAEDHGALRSALVSVLEGAGFVVEPYATGSQLAERLLDGSPPSSSRPDVVVTDMYMPGPTGLQVLQALRNGGDPVPFVLMSGSLNPMFGRERRNLEPVAFLSKPFDLADFVSTVRHLAGGFRPSGELGALRRPMAG